MMKKEYSAMFDKLAPQKSDEELLQAVLSEKADIMGEMKKRKRKAIIIPALVAAVLCATTIGVSAANDWKLTAVLSDGIKNIFGKKNGLAPADKSFAELGFNQLRGKELNDVIDCGEYNIELKGVTADKYTAFLLYDIIFNNGFDYKLSSGEEWCALWYQSNYTDWVSDFKRGDQPNSGGYSQNEFLSMDGNIAHCYTEITAGIPLQGRTMELTLQGLYRGSTENPEIGKEIDCGSETFSTISITFDFDTLASSKTIEPNAEITVDDLGSGTLTYLSASPFGFMMNFVWENGEKLREFVGMEDNGHEKWVNALNFKVKFKNGDEKDVTAFYDDFAGNSFGYNGTITRAETSIFPHWSYPVNVDDIESVTVCGKTFEIN